MRDLTFSHKATILDLVTVEGWGEGKLPNPLPIKHPIAIQDGGIDDWFIEHSLPNL